jgi:hypothetical protein
VLCGGEVGQLEEPGTEELALGDKGFQSVLCRLVEERGSLLTSIEVKTLKGFRASSSASMGRNAVETTGTELLEASRRS